MKETSNIPSFSQKQHVISCLSYPYKKLQVGEDSWEKTVKPVLQVEVLGIPTLEFSISIG